jgi:hypothetical protein
VRRLKTPTLGQWGCHHRWKTTHSLPQEDALHRVRYHKCLRCGLRVKTEERLAVPWSEAELLVQILTLLPEGEPVYLRDRGITELPLEALNTVLARQGYQIHASQSWNVKQAVACVDQAGRVGRYALFELRRMPPMAPGGTNGALDKGRSRHHGTGHC